MIKIRNLDTESPSDNPTSNNNPVLDLPCPKTNPNLDSDTLQIQAKLAAKFGARVTITGQWVWAGFDGKPNKETLDTLKANNWIWCRNKGKWAYRGKPSHSRKSMSWDYITNKYGQQNIEEENT